MASEWSKMKLEELSNIMGNATPGSIHHTMAWAEFMRRQTEFIRGQTRAQIRAANYMAVALIAIAVSSGITAGFAFLSWWLPHAPQ